MLRRICFFTLLCFFSANADQERCFSYLFSYNSFFFFKAASLSLSVCLFLSTVGVSIQTAWSRGCHRPRLVHAFVSSSSSSRSKSRRLLHRYTLVCVCWQARTPFRPVADEGTSHTMIVKRRKEQREREREAEYASQPQKKRALTKVCFIVLYLKKKTFFALEE